jgi:large subunit ribosomal protein L21
MYAVVRTGGKQYRVAADDLITVERLPGEEGDIVTLGEVLMLGEGAKVTVGAPFVAGAAVAGEIVEQGRGKKIIVFKKRRRQNYRRKKGHRQLLTVLKVTEILTDGAKPSKKASGKKPAKAKAAKAEPKKVEAEAVEATPSFKDDVAQIGGVGPKMKEKLESYGITSLKQLAAMSEDDVAKMDEALELHGRAARDEWVVQARELIAGKTPRAKADRE